jgi:hypothetical protein
MHGRARGKSPDLQAPSVSLVSHAYTPGIWTPPCALAHANAATVLETFPCRGAALRRLAVVRQRLAKGRSFP